MISQSTTDAWRLFKETTVIKQLWPPILGTRPSPFPPLCPGHKNPSFVRGNGSDCCRGGCETRFQPKGNLVEASEHFFIPFQIREKHTRRCSLHFPFCFCTFSTRGGKKGEKKGWKSKEERKGVAAIYGELDTTSPDGHSSQATCTLCYRIMIGKPYPLTSSLHVASTR